MSDTENQFNNLYGQLAALEHLVLALLVEHPNKSAVQAEFLRQTEENETHDLYSTRPEAFLKGFAMRQKMLADLLAEHLSNLHDKPE